MDDCLLIIPSKNFPHFFRTSVFYKFLTSTSHIKKVFNVSLARFGFYGRLFHGT